MPSGTEMAVTQAARLNEIGFPEFTAKLITDTFDCLVAANIRQTQAYIELVQQISKSLTQFINDTRDDINGEQLLQFLAGALPCHRAALDFPGWEIENLCGLERDGLLYQVIRNQGGEFVRLDDAFAREQQFAI